MTYQTTPTSGTYRSSLDPEIGTDLPCRADVFRTLHGVFWPTVSVYRKCFVIRFELSFPPGGEYPADNSVFARFTRSLMRHRRREGFRPRCVWVRHGVPADHQQRYQVVLLLAVKTAQSVTDHLHVAESIWARSLGIADARGLVNYCLADRQGRPKKNGFMIRWDSSKWEATCHQCLHAIGDMARIQEKGTAPVNARDFGYTRT